MKDFGNRASEWSICSLCGSRKHETVDHARLNETAPELADALQESLVWLIVACSPVENYKAARSAMTHLRKYIAILERAGVDPQIRMQGLDEIEAEIAKAEATCSSNF